MNVEKDKEWLEGLDISKPDHKISREELHEKYETLKRRPATYGKNGKFETSDFLAWYDEIYNEKDSTPLYMKISNRCIERFNVICLTESEQFMIKDGNHYQLQTEPLELCISTQIHDSKERGFINLYNTVEKNLRKTTKVSEKDFYFGTSKIPFLNGYFDIEDWKLHDYKDCKKYFSYVIPYDYITDKEYDCKKFKKLCKDWFGDNIEYDDVIDLMGYTMCSHTGYKVIPTIYGKKNAGKTQFTNILFELYGSDNSSSISWQGICRNDFGPVYLQNKIFNCSGDMGSKSIKDASNVKAISGGGKVGAEIKGGKRFMFQPIVILWADLNKLPIFQEVDDDALYYRIILLEFKQNFEKTQEGFVPDVYKNITEDPEEMQGIIHECMKGLKRVIENKGFSDKLRENTQYKYNVITNDVFRFLKECCEEKKNLECSYDHAWDVFCERYGSGLGRSKFTKRLEALGHRKKDRGAKRSPRYVYLGFKVKESKEWVNLDSFKNEENEDPYDNYTDEQLEAIYNEANENGEDV